MQRILRRGLQVFSAPVYFKYLLAQIKYGLIMAMELRFNLGSLLRAMHITSLGFLALLVVGGVQSQRTRVRTVQCVPGKAQFPNPSDRHSFYKCDAGGNPILFQCPPGTWFNPRLEVCDWDTGGSDQGGSSTTTEGSNNWQTTRQSTTQRPPATARPTPDWNNAQSTARTTRNPWDQTSTLPSTRVPTTGRDWWNGRPDGEGGGNNGASTTSRPVIGGACDPRGPSLIPNPGDCSTFFTCRQSRLQINICPGGLYFSPQSASCQRDIPEGCTLNDAWARRG